MGNLNYIVFGGVDSRDYGIYISGEGVFNAPERDVEVVNIPGKDGDLLIDRGRFLNIEVTYPGFNFEPDLSTFAERLRAFRAALASQIGYQRLEDSFHPDEFRLASFRSGLDINPVMYNTASTFDIAFDCKPQRFLKSGEEEIDPSEWGETETKTGEIVSFEAESNTGIKSLVVGIEPNQSGSGDPSPDNIRPISGWDEVKVNNCRKNLFDESRLLEARGWAEADGVYTGEIGALANIGNLLPTFDYTGLQFCINFDALVVPPTSTNRAGYVAIKYTDGTITYLEIKEQTWTHISEVTRADKTVERIYAILSNAKVISLKNFQIELGSTATAYEPYQGESKSIPFKDENGNPITVYGGNMNIAGGEGDDTYYNIIFNGEETDFYQSSTRWGWLGSVLKYPYAQNQHTYGGMCSHFKYGSTPEGGECVVGLSSQTGAYFLISKTSLPDIATLDEFKAWVAEQYANGTPLQVTYILATPTPIYCEPTEVNTLLGVNNIWADSGEVSVEYGDDPNILVNPTPFEALPLFEVVGTGSLTVGNTTIGITGDSTQDIFIDSDIMEAYEDDNGAIISRNDRINLSGTDFPKLGEETRVESNGLTSVKITPRWWTI